MDDIAEKIKDFLTFDIIVLIVLGFCIGVYSKSIAAQNITVGFSDPKAQTEYEVYNIDALEQNLISQGIPPEVVPGDGGAGELGGETAAGAVLVQ